MTEQPELSMRDTKATILSEYERALETIEELKAQQFSPTEIKQREADEMAIMTAEGMDWSLGNVFVAIREKIDQNLREMQSNLEKEKEDLEQVRRAKTALQRELKDLYGISTQAQSFAALVEAQQDRKAKFETELAEQKQRMREEYEHHRDTITTAEVDAQAARARREEEWEYDFERKCQVRNDRINDDLAAKMKEHNTLIEAEYKQLEGRKEAIAKQEDEIQELRERVAEIPNEIDAATEDARKKMAASYGIEIGALKRNHEADSKILAHEAKVLMEANTALKAQVLSLEDKLEKAYEKIQGVAAQALEASGNARTTAEVQRAVQSSAPTGKR
jgi:hypothetical protein